jgi:hypothetical protein
MSFAIMIPAQIDLGYKEMASNAMTHATKRLAEKYGFDEKEALLFLNLNDIKLQLNKETKKSKKAAKKAANVDKPKRAQTGYQWFCKAQRAAAVSNLEAKLAEGEKFQPKQVFSELGRMWKAIEQGERDVWIASAKEQVSDDSQENSESESE